MRIRMKEKIGQPIQRRYASEIEVERLTGIKRRTLQKHRVFGRGFPFYRVGGRVLYDLREVEQVIEAGRVEVAAR